MNHSQPILLKSLFLLAVFMTIAVSSSAQVEKFIGRAVNTNGQLEFIEEHSVKYKNAQIASLRTTYFDADYKKIGEIKSDFSSGSRFGSYDFKDERLQYIDGAKVLSDRIMVYAQKTPQDKVKKKFLKRDSDQILGQGFHPFIQENFEALLQGKIFAVKLVLPSQMDQFNVRICPAKEAEGRLLLRIELDNWFLRLFSPTIEVEYDTDTRRLLAYRGVSAISNASGKHVAVAISYTYFQQSPLTASK